MASAYIASPTHYWQGLDKNSNCQDLWVICYMNAFSKPLVSTVAVKAVVGVKQKW